MKRIFVSDIHGSFTNLRRVIEWIDTWQVDQMIILGDILYHGPRNDFPEGYNPRQCIDLLNKYKHMIVAVRGNCDSEVDQMVLGFPMMADYALVYDDTQSIFITHGHIYHEQAMPVLKPNVFVSGHTHVPVMNFVDGVHLLNPGSISIPKNGSVASFGYMENGLFRLMDLDGVCLSSYDCRRRGCHE